MAFADPQDEWPITGHAEIDRQHRELHLVVADLGGHRLLPRHQISALLGLLTSLAKAHFAFEDDLMHASGYPAADSHRSAHRDILGRLLQVEDALRTGLDSHLLLDGLIDLWLRHHISSADANLARHLASTGQGQG